MSRLSRHALTANAFRTLLIGSPVRMAFSLVVLGVLVRLIPGRTGMADATIITLSVTVAVAVAASLIYHRNEWHYRQLEAMQRLAACLQLAIPLPPLRGWRLAPDAACILARLILSERPQVIVEAGSGVSTVLCGLLCRQLGTGRVIALEHDHVMATRTREQIQALGLDDLVDVLHAPLRTTRIGNGSWVWYDVSQIPPDVEIDLLLVDGPPVWIQAEARYPALPLLRERLSSGAVVFLDDSRRYSERSVLKHWAADCADLKIERHDTEDGTAIARFRKTGSPDV